MKTCFLHLLALLLAATTATAQENYENITASLGTEGKTATAPSASNVRQGSAVLRAIRPVTVAYKDAPWFLLVVDIPDEKQVVHFTQEQLEAIRAIVDAKDGKTHYLEVTNFFEVYTGRGNTVIDHYFENSVRFAISKKHWYRNNALFMVSSLVVDDQHVIRFQIPFANEARICKHLKDAHNLEKEYHEASPAEFLRLFTVSATPDEMRANAE